METALPGERPETKRRSILLTFDVEEWFQVENFKEWISYDSWPSRESRVERSTRLVLDLLDACGPKNRLDSSSGTCGPRIRATFFVLGWVAEKHPGLVREIHRRGHEVASHGYGHELTGKLPPATLMEDIRRSKVLLEDLIGATVSGYRAPNFTASIDLLNILDRLGFRYDSSYNSLELNPRYGRLEIRNGLGNGIAFRPHGGLMELPISNLRMAGHTIPLGGGGYFRLFPLPLWRWGVRTILQKQDAYLMYLHPWEFDPGQPVVAEAAALRKFRHYHKLHQTAGKLAVLLQSFGDCEFPTCLEYAETLETPKGLPVEPATSTL